MTISNVAVDGPLLQSTHQAIIDNVNGSPYRQIITANTAWSVPAGCHKFKVYLAGGGGGGGLGYASGGEFSIDYPGGYGGEGPMCSKIISGQEVGTTFAVTIGAGGAASVGAGGATGGNSTFGALLTSTGGLGGSDAGIGGANGTHSGDIGHANNIFLDSSRQGYGAGGVPGVGASSSPVAGRQGICIIEW